MNDLIVPNDNIWGRTTTGQAIKMDYVIREIVKNLHGGIEIIKE